jgi:Na+/H+ antiporter NhaB
MSLEAKNRSAPSALVSARRQSGWATDQFWDRFAPVAFCVFMASLIAFLVLTYSGVPIV